jgi:hypothetical protein
MLDLRGFLSQGKPIKDQLRHPFKQIIQQSVTADCQYCSARNYIPVDEGMDLRTFLINPYTLLNMIVEFYSRENANCKEHHQ